MTTNPTTVPLEQLRQATKSIAVVAHDAGAASLLFSWLKSFDAELINDDIGNENFITAVENWDDKDSVKQRKKFAKDFSNITAIDKRRAN